MVQVVLHTARQVRLHIGHHVVHPVRYALHAMAAYPRVILGFACRTALGWTATGLLALPLPQPSLPLPAQPPITTPLDVQRLQVPSGAVPLPAQQSSSADSPAEGSTGATSDPRAVNAGASTVALQVIAQPVITAPLAPAPLPLLPTKAPATRPILAVPPDKIARDIALEFLDTPQAVPEPSSMLVLTTGFYSLRWLRRRRQPLVKSRT